MLRTSDAMFLIYPPDMLLYRDTNETPPDRAGLAEEARVWAASLGWREDPGAGMYFSTFFDRDSSGRDVVIGYRLTAPAEMVWRAGQISDETYSKLIEANPLRYDINMTAKEAIDAGFAVATEAGRYSDSKGTIPFSNTSFTDAYANLLVEETELGRSARLQRKVWLSSPE